MRMWYTQVETIPNITKKSWYKSPVFGMFKYKLVPYSLTHALELTGTLLWPRDSQPSPRHIRILADM